MFQLQFKILLLIFITQTVSSLENNCIITSFSEVNAVLGQCKDIVISNLIVPGGQQLKLDLQEGSTVTFKGTILFEVAYWEGHLVRVTGKKVLVQGAPGSVLNAQGEKYWDGKGGSGGVTKPKFFEIATEGGSVFRNITLLNCAMFCVGVHAKDVHIYGWNLDVSAGRKKGGRNTDGFGVSNSHNVLIEDSIVNNQDDCVVVNSGTDMIFRNLKCYGSHGLSFSIGSNTDDNVVSSAQNITFQNCYVADGSFGIHVKTKRGNGLISHLTYENIQFSGLQKEGIYINQDYGDNGNVSRKFQITDLKLHNVHGSVGKNAIPIHIVCNKNRCSNWSWSEIHVTGKKKNSCNYKPSGFSC